MPRPDDKTVYLLLSVIYLNFGPSYYLFKGVSFHGTQEPNDRGPCPPSSQKGLILWPHAFATFVLPS